MKKYLIIFILIFSAGSTKIIAQAFQNGDFVIDVGTSIRSYNDGIGSNHLYIGLLASAEKGVHKWIGVGGSLGTGFYKGAPIYIGGSGSLHLLQMIEDLSGSELGTAKLDIALKPSLGLYFGSFAGTSYSNLRWGTSIYARYYINDNFALYVETGRPAIGYLVGGVSYKF